MAPKAILKASTKTNVIDEEETKLFTTCDNTIACGPISQCLSIHEFMEDMKHRFPDQMKDITHVVVYLFPEYVEVKRHDTNAKLSGNKTTISKHYVYFYPEMITLVNSNVESNDRFKTLKRSAYDVYLQHGVRFETHVPLKELNDKNVYVPMKDDNGEIVMNGYRELKEESKVNYLVIPTEANVIENKSKYNVFGKSKTLYYSYHVCAESAAAG